MIEAIRDWLFLRNLSFLGTFLYVLLSTFLVMKSLSDGLSAGLITLFITIIIGLNEANRNKGPNRIETAISPNIGDVAGFITKLYFTNDQLVGIKYPQKSKGL